MLLSLIAVPDGVLWIWRAKSILACFCGYFHCGFKNLYYNKIFLEYVWRLVRKYAFLALCPTLGAIFLPYDEFMNFMAEREWRE